MKTFTIKIKITEGAEGVEINIGLSTAKNKAKFLFGNQDKMLKAAIESYPDDFEPKDSLPKDTELNSFITIVLVDAEVKISNELNTHSTITKAQYRYIVKSVFERLNKEILEIFLKERDKEENENTRELAYEILGSCPKLKEERDLLEVAGKKIDKFFTLDEGKEKEALRKEIDALVPSTLEAVVTSPLKNLAEACFAEDLKKDKK